MAFAEQKIVVTEGKYVMGDLDSKKETKALALIDAKRLALEQAVTSTILELIIYPAIYMIWRGREISKS